VPVGSIVTDRLAERLPPDFNAAAFFCDAIFLASKSGEGVIDDCCWLTIDCSGCCAVVEPLRELITFCGCFLLFLAFLLSVTFLDVGFLAATTVVCLADAVAPSKQTVDRVFVFLVVGASSSCDG